MLKTSITDPANGLTASVVDGIDPHALVVAVRPLKYFKPETLFFTNETYGINMNINAGSSGTPEKVHNGTDNAYWTGSNIVGTKAVFNNTDFAKDGTRSVSITNPNINDVWQFLKSSPMSPTDYDALTFWIYVASDWGVGDSISLYGYDTATSSIIGNVTHIEDFFNVSDYGKWQKITLPLELFGSTLTIDALRFQIVSRAGAKSPTFYLDVIQFEETGNPIIFKINPPPSTWLYINSLKLIFVDAYDGARLNNSMPSLSYDKILNQTLVSGINYQQTNDRDDVIFSITFNNLFDILQIPNASIHDLVCDGTNAMMTIKDKMIDQQIVLRAENDDSLSLTISEDLTGFIAMRALITGYSEDRCPLSSGKSEWRREHFHQ